MSWSGWRRGSGRLLGGAGALVLAVGLTGCFGAGPPPSTNFPPQWSSTTVNFLHTQTPAAGNASGWVTTVTVQPCNDAEGPTTIVGSVSNGFLIPQGNGTFAWTRAVSGSSPVTRVAGTFTADCKDSSGQLAHPTLSVPG